MAVGVVIVMSIVFYFGRREKSRDEMNSAHKGRSREEEASEEFMNLDASDIEAAGDAATPMLAETTKDPLDHASLSSGGGKQKIYVIS